MAKPAHSFLGVLLVFGLLAVPAQAQTINCDGVLQWTASHVFFPGDRTVHEGSLYEARAVIHTVPPTTWVVNGWGVKIGDCGGVTQDPLAVTLLGAWTA